VTRTPEFLDEALEDAEQAARWYAERSPAAAIAFSDEVDRAVGEIERSPLAWPPYDHGTRRFLLTRFPYSVVYRADSNGIVIVAVAHAHRRPGFWRDRLG
jgi:plasmid stabilization system protein ParE